MARTKGNIDITNDGKIKLKKGQSYHITVRGRYNQTVLKDNYTYASYIEYVTNNSININIDESRSDSQYFELSYDLFKLNRDTDYYVFFTLDDATVNDLFIEIHSLANVGGNGSSGGSSPEYDAGYGIQILNNVISVSGIAPQVQSDWNQTNTSSVDYIKNKPEEYGLLAGDNISITASGNNFIISSTASAATGVNYQAGYGIDITGDTISVDASIIPSTSAYATHTEVNNVSAAIIAQIPEQQVNSDWTATSGVAEILNKPNESELIAGPGVSITASGSNYIISAVVTGSPVISGYVTEAELETVSGTLNTKIDNVSASIPELPDEEEVEFEELDLSDYALASAIPDVSGFATVELVSDVSGKLPTTELGKFTIHNNVSGGPIKVICPTDQGFPIETVILDNNQVSGSTGSGTSSVYIVYKSPGYDDDYYSAEGPAILHIPEAVTGLAQIQIVYAPNSNPASKNGPSFTNPSYIYGDSTGGRYVLDAGDYDVNVIANQTPPGAGYGKYITLCANGPAPDVQALLKSSFSLAVRHPELGITVNLDRYALGNSSTITNTSGYSQAVIYTDPTSKKQSVYLPNYMPSNWSPNSNIAQAFEYGNKYVSPSDSYYATKLYKAYKYTSSPRRYQFAYCTDWDYANKVMTFIAYDDSGNAIEKWTVDYTTYGSAVWTTEPISSGGASYTAGSGIDITNNVISVDDTVAFKADIPVVTGYIPYSASGVYLPNSKFEIDTEGQAYKVGESTETNYGSWDSTDACFAYGQYYSYYTLPTRNSDGYGTLKAGTYRFTLPNTVNSIIVRTRGNIAAAYNGLVITATNHVAYLIITEDLTFNPNSNIDYIRIEGYTNDDGTGSYVNLNRNNSSAVYISPVIKYKYITETALTEAISAVTGAVVYQAGDYIGITDDIISVTGITDLVAGDNITITASGSSAIISATGGEGDVTIEELASVSGALETEIQVVSASIPELPTEEEVEFEELDLSDYALASAIPDVSNLATKSELQTVSAAIPDVSNLATKSELQTVSAAIPDVSNFATETYVNNAIASIDIPDPLSGASGVKVEDSVVSLDNPIGLVAGTNVSIEVTGSSAIISAVGGSGTSDVTMADLVSVSGTLQAEIQTVSGSIPTLPTEEEVEFEELDLSNYALASAIPDVSNLSTKAELNAVSAEIPTLPQEEEIDFEEIELSDYALASAIPDVTNLATKSEVQAVSASIPTLPTEEEVDFEEIELSDYALASAIPTLEDLNTQGITDIQVVQTLPASPVSSVLYLIPET